MAHETRHVAGFEVDLETSKDGKVVHSACVLVGPDDKPGWRHNDGPDANQKRREVRQAVMAALGLDTGQVQIVARYSELMPVSNGLVGVRNGGGKIIGVFGKRYFTFEAAEREAIRRTARDGKPRGVWANAGGYWEPLTEEEIERREE